MRVCLINPPGIHPISWGNKPHILQPTEIAYIAALLERHHETWILDAYVEGWKNIKKVNGTKYRVGLESEEVVYKIKQCEPDVVGIDIPYSSWSKTAFEVASALKSINKDIVVVVHGLHPSARPLDCIASQNVDFAVIGEPEYTMLELVESLEQGVKSSLKKIRGIAFMDNGRKVITPPRHVIQDLDSLPFPARHLLPMEKYFAAVRENPLRGEIRKPWASMITSRGCPFNCIFCTVHIVAGKQWRARSPENVVKEIEHLVQTYHVKQIDFLDENMTMDKKRMEAICDLIIERGLEIEWYTPNGVRADTLDENLLKKMKESGCKRIYIAPESGVQRVVDKIIKKNLSLEEVEKAIYFSKKVGIKVSCFFIIGLIGETKEDINATINYAYKLRQLGADKFYFSYATPLYGTELYNQAKQYGYLRNGFSDESLGGAVPLIETPEFTAEELRELCAKANLINRTYTRDKLVRAIREPKKTIKTLLGNKL
jgi:magnesium-protoporphyrin IX monomethyl ester (oxidative) cyclase